MRPLLILLLAACLSLATVGGRGGLEAVAVRRDGKLLAVGGQNRTVYLLDAATLEVKRRLPVLARVGALAWSPDGKSLYLEDETDTLRRIEPESGKELFRMADVSGMTLSPSGDLLAVRDLKRPDRPGVRVLDAASLEEKWRLSLAERASAFSFSADSKRLAVLEGGHETTEEKRTPLRETPEALKGLARQEFQQKNDGRRAWLHVCDVLEGKTMRRTSLWYTSDSDSTRLTLAGEQVTILNQADTCARVGADGAVTMFALGERSIQTLATDGKGVFIGGRAGGSRGPLDGKRHPFALDELPGKAEFVGGWAILPDGSAVGVTTAWRVFQLGKDGKMGKTANVF